jgi:signal transduction histidine kinase
LLPQLTLAAFCDVILAELHRLEAQTSDKAKSDFISTMSHELRSPLHGILGSVECLQEQPTDSISSDLISQVDICGRTLLDIIDHLLDFSKINHHAKARTGVLIDARGRRISTPAAKSRSRMGGMMTLSADIALDHVTEEVVETAVYSFCCSRDPGMILKRKVAVILDIDKSSHIDWSCHVAVGAWKRICINLVSNALKYTSEGHIKISLKASPIPDKKKRFNVTLSVSDTGRGMSRDFLENHLFRAFEQEDSFVEGTGLGMNLVSFETVREMLQSGSF